MKWRGTSPSEGSPASDKRCSAIEAQNGTIMKPDFYTLVPRDHPRSGVLSPMPNIVYRVTIRTTQLVQTQQPRTDNTTFPSLECLRGRATNRI